MPIDYQALAATAVRLITENGRRIDLMTAGEPNPSEPWCPGEEAPRPLTAVQSEDSNSDRGEVNASSVRRKYLVASDGRDAPKPGERIRDQGEIFPILSVEQVKPGNVVMYWAIEVAG